MKIMRHPANGERRLPVFAARATTRQRADAPKAGRRRPRAAGLRTAFERARTLRSTALAILSLAWAASSFAAEPPRDPATLPAPKRIVVPKLQSALVVDGDLNETVWQKAAVLEGFTENDGSAPGREATVVRVWYDDKSLYLGWTCTDADVQATFTARDSKFWEEEVAEFFITPKDLSRYFELQWNPLGGVFDAIISNELDARNVSKKMNGDWTFTASAMLSAVKLKGTAGNASDRDEAWVVEVAIPFSDLGQAAPKPGDTWRANFYRFNRGKDKPVEKLAWSPTLLPGFHQPARFGFLEFGK